MGFMDSVKNGVKNVKNTKRKITLAIKFLATPIGQAVGWILLIIILLILIYILSRIAANGIERLFGLESFGGVDFNAEDLAIFNELTSNGYESLIPAEKTQDFLNYEYAVLMDVARSIEETGVYEMMEYREYDFEKIEEYDQAKGKASHWSGQIYNSDTYKNEVGFTIGGWRY